MKQLLTHEYTHGEFNKLLKAITGKELNVYYDDDWGLTFSHEDGAMCDTNEEHEIREMINKKLVNLYQLVPTYSTILLCFEL